MADSKSGAQSKHKPIIIAGDDGTLYHLSEDDLKAHRMEDSHPAHAHAKKLVHAKQHGVIGPEHFKAESAVGISTDISYRMLNLGALGSGEE